MQKHTCFKQEQHKPSRRCGFTLIELLVVMSIIGVLASLILPAIGKAKVKAKVQIARTEMNNIVGAVSAYFAQYNRFPVTSRVMDFSAANANTWPDFTYGTTDNNGVLLRNKANQALPAIKNMGLNPVYNSHNAEIIGILMDDTNLVVNGVRVNENHSRNPEKTQFLNAKVVSSIQQSGVGPDGVYRDTFGSPYIITLDMNGDNKCRDAFYRVDAVSRDPSDTGGMRGYNGLAKPAPVAANAYEARTQVMVWSFGPDGMANPTVSAKAPPNKDNILSWQ